ncbi:MAG: LuxR C-terminal-related transcriptional regulator [Nocardioides sp.]
MDSAHTRPFVERLRLTPFLDSIPSTPVSTIVTPAGCGKTAVARAWSEGAVRAGIDVRWLSPTDVDALRSNLSETPGHRPPVLVVDDAHRIPDDGVELLRAHLRDAPDSTRLLLLGRRALTFVPVSLTLEHRAQSLRAADLRLDDVEAAALVRAHHPEADAVDLGRVVEQGGGWAAALVLAAHTLRTADAGETNGHASAETRVALTAVTRSTLDYLTNEVFAGYSPGLQQVLLATCQQPEVTSDDAIVMSGLPSAGDLLEQAAEDGLVVTRIRGFDTPPSWRYHPLLVELLRRRTAPSGPHWAVVAQAHERAARHHRRHGDAAAALHHASMSGDVNLQLLTLREFTPELLARGQGRLVTESLRLVPDAVRDNLPAVTALEALVLRSLQRYDAAKAAADLALARRPVRGDREPDRELQTDLAILEVWLARCGWRPAAGAESRAAEALQCRHGGPGATSEHDTSGVSPLRSAMLMLDLAALQMWAGDLESAGVHAHGADRYAHQVELPRLGCAVLAVRATLELAHSAYQSAAISAQACLDLHRSAGLDASSASSRALLVRGWARFHALQLDGATSDLAAVEAEAHHSLEPVDIVYIRLLKASLLTARGAAGAACRLLDTRGAVPDRLPPFADRHTRLARLQASGRLGDLSAVESEANGLRAAGFPGDAALVRALAVGVGGSERTAIYALEALLSDGNLSEITAASAAVGRVALLHRLGTPSDAHRAQQLVPDLLSRVEPQKLLWVLATGTFISPRFTDLLAAEAGLPDGHPYAAEAYAELEAHPHRGPVFNVRGVTGGSANPATGEKWPNGLTDREVDVLRELALGGSNAMIAHSLFVSENTIKTHLASIYRKLEVDGRAGALTAARGLHVL